MDFYLIECDCVDCLKSDSPCYLDCDVGEMCLGCREAFEEAKDRLHDEMCGLGWK